MAPRYRFDRFVLDVDRRELRRDDEVRTLQPQAFDVLVYLVTHRDRVIGKAELLDVLWPDAVVTDASLQRAISLARHGLGDLGDAIIQTHARRGYRFAAEVGEERGDEAASSPAPAPAAAAVQYARTRDGVSLAWTTLGAGPVDIVVIPGWTFALEAWSAHPRPRAFIERLSSAGRVILFDRRGVGLSDRVKTRPTFEERASDLDAVLAACAARRAIVVGISEGGPIALRHAAGQRDTTAGLVLVGAFARMAAAPDHPAGWSAERVDGLRGYIRQSWGAGATIRAIVPRHAADPEVQRWAAEVERRGASPGAALDLLEMNVELDARPLLADVDVPAVVLHHREDAVMDVDNGRLLARALRHVRYVEATGDDHAFLFDDSDLLDWAVRSLIP